MRPLPLLLCLLGGLAQAAEPTVLTLPPITLTPTTPAAPAGGLQAVPTAPLVFQVARQVLVQPSRLEVQLAPGYSIGTLNFSLFSPVNTQVILQPEDPRLVVRDGQAPLRLLANQIQGVSAVASAPHSGMLRVLNTQGELIVRVPYVVLPPRKVNQSVYFNYAPAGNTASLSYGVSGVPQTTNDPRWSAGVNVGINTSTNTLSGGVSIGVNW